MRSRRVRQRTGNAGTTTHVIEPAVDARFVRLNITRPSYSGEPVARIYEFEVYGPDGRQNLALGRPATGSRALQPGSGAGEGRERQRRGRQDRQLVRRRLALVPAGGSGRGASGDALRREARQRGRRKRGVRHPRVQHPGEHGRQRPSPRSRRLRAPGSSRSGPSIASSSTSTGGGRPGSCSSTASWSPEHRPPAELRRGSDDLRGDLPVLLPAAGDLLRLSRHLHVSLPRGDEQPDAALLVSRAGAARGAARGEVCGRADRVCRDLRRRRPARALRP